MIPQDMRDLLIRLDQRVDDGFKSMNDKLDAQSRRADSLESRVRDLEVWRSEMQGSAKGLSTGYKVLTAAAGALFGVLGMLGVQNVLPHKPVAKVETTIERSVHIPTQR
ncbi:hypothetical protein ASE73_07675 [Sphingomonas sp. Leaf24]|nr:hypothetical protein ASE50_16785 [Sphingomonas sp. Leaf5]KQM89455.1 hypothetical protein ASE73_07675 [Sphingomonas sp. Leaf24]